MKQTLLNQYLQFGFAALLAAILLDINGAVAGTFSVSSLEEVDAVRARAEASQFLSYTTFGPTVDEIDTLAERIISIGRHSAFKEWIATQVSLPATYHKSLAVEMVLDEGFALAQEGIDVDRYRDYAWWHAAIDGKDQLRQRIAWALAQIFVVNDTGPGFNQIKLDTSGEPRWLGLSDYYDMLVRNAFGNYRDTLTDVTLHPIMGVFLSHANNSKGDPSINLYPDENYAREVMQLFSIGLYKLNRSGVIKKDVVGNYIETYDNDDIRSFARVFTGLTFAGEYAFPADINYLEPMQMVEENHDTDKKVLLSGTVLPARQSGMEDIQAALDNLFEHSNVGPFIARRLIQRFVKSNPSKGYIGRVAAAFNDNGHGERGDFRAVIEAILLDPEVWRSQKYKELSQPHRLKVVSRGTEYTRLREPLLRYTAFLRAFNPTSDHHTGRFLVASKQKAMNQAPYQAASVFNFYRPDYQPAGDILNHTSNDPAGPGETTTIRTSIPDHAIFAPEFQILTPPVTNKFANLLRTNVYDSTAQFKLYGNSRVSSTYTRVGLDFSTESKLANKPAVLMEHLDILLCHGTMGDNVKQIIEDVVTAETEDNLERAEAAILATLTSSACSVSN